MALDREIYLCIQRNNTDPADGAALRLAFPLVEPAQLNVVESVAALRKDGVSVNSQSFESLVRAFPDSQIDWAKRWICLDTEGARVYRSSSLSASLDFLRFHHSLWQGTSVELRAGISQFDFSVTSLGSVHSQWHNLNYRKYRRNCIGGVHQDHGFLCAFRGLGHNILGSREWLHHGPWRLIRDEAKDISFVEFHDWEADWETALTQAQPGHQRMGCSKEGGVVENLVSARVINGKVQRVPFKFQHFAPSHFDRSTGTSIVLVRDRVPDPHEFVEAMSAKYHQPYEGLEIQQVAFVYFDEALARLQLPELYLRGLDCRLMGPTGEVSLCADYTPPPYPVPDWVKRVRDRDGY